MPPMFYVLVVVAGLLALEGVSLLLRARGSNPERVRERLRKLAPRIVTAQSASESLVREARDSGALARLRAALPGLSSLDLLLYRAGSPVTLTRFLVLTALLAVAGFALVTVIYRGATPAALGLLAGLIPWLAVRRSATRRMRRFEEQLPEALELVTRALRVGHGLTAGFQLVGQELDDPIGTEFGLVAEEVRFGLELRDALQNLMRRVDNADLPYFVTAVLIQRQTGGNLAELLDKLSALIRERAQFHGKVRALTAQGRGAALFLACWLPFIIVILMLTTPTYLQPLFENTWGHVVLASAAFIDVFAYILARRIADVQA